MSHETLQVSSAHSHSSCLHTIGKSKWTDAALITGFIALLVIGILASTGVFNFIGTTNAAYLSYGMYGSAALLLMAEVIKIVVKYCHKVIDQRQFAYQLLQRPVPTDYKCPVQKQSYQLSQEIISDIRIKAKYYAGNNTHVCQLSKNPTADTQRILEYIEKIIDDTEFQQDPKAFLNAWQANRNRGMTEKGMTEKRIFPEPHATYFFSLYPQMCFPFRKPW